MERILWKKTTGFIYIKSTLKLSPVKRQSFCQGLNVMMALFEMVIYDE